MPMETCTHNVWLGYSRVLSSDMCIGTARTYSCVLSSNPAQKNSKDLFTSAILRECAYEQQGIMHKCSPQTVRIEQQEPKQVLENRKRLNKKRKVDEADTE